jgi:hypothetical protein
MTSTRLDTVGVGGGATLPWIQFDFSDFDINLSQVASASNYTFTGGDFSAGKFTVDTTGVGSSSTVTFLPSVGTDGYLPEATQIKLVVATGVLRNEYERNDVDITFSTSRQTTTVTDRETDAIIPNTGGVIDTLFFSDSAASQPSSIDSLVFTTTGYIPADGKIKIAFPPQFTMTTTRINNVKILYDSAGTHTLWGAHAAKRNELTYVDGEIDEVSLSNGTVINNEIILQLTGVTGNVIQPGSRIGIQIGDTSGYRGTGISVVDTAFFNPSAEYAGTYPTTGSRSPIVVTITDANDNVISQGTNSSAKVRINTITWGSLGYVVYDQTVGAGSVVSAYDSTALFGEGRSGDAAFQDSVESPGDSLALRLWFVLGEQLSMRDDDASGKPDRSDTLFIDVGNYFQVDPEDTSSTAIV